jgi:AcrR family transcriptional regulator
MAVYRHFANKEDLLRALGEEAFDVWLRRIESIKEPDFDKWLQKVSRAYIEFALDEPARFDASYSRRASSASIPKTRARDAPPLRPLFPQAL